MVGDLQICRLVVHGCLQHNASLPQQRALRPMQSGSRR